MDKRDSIINVVTSPLGFFALALLIIEGFLAIVVIGAGSSLADNAKLWGMFIAAGAFLVVVSIVALMVWKIPNHLTYRGSDWMEDAKLKKNWADQGEPLTKPQLEKLEQTEQASLS